MLTQPAVGQWQAGNGFGVVGTRPSPATQDGDGTREISSTQTELHLFVAPPHFDSSTLAADSSQPTGSPSQNPMAGIMPPLAYHRDGHANFVFQLQQQKGKRWRLGSDGGSPGLGKISNIEIFITSENSPRHTPTAKTVSTVSTPPNPQPTPLPPQPLRSPGAKLFTTRSPPSHRESHLIHQSVPHLAHRVDVHSPRPSSIRASQSHPPARLVITEASATRSTVQYPMSTSKPPLKALRCASHRSNNGKSRVSFIPRDPRQDLCSAQAQAKPTHRRRTDHLAAARGIRALRVQSADDAAANHSFVEIKKISSSVLPPLLLPALQAACSIRPLFASIPSLRPSSMRHRKRPVNQRQLAWWMRACATHGVV